ncbi:MAG: DUF333 domain-containing protein [Neisseria sp.]|nr:DUF333 domain-containing protein [Neisseria sp.]
MFKTSIAAATLALTLSACQNHAEPESPMIGMSNPASEFCVKQGGKLESKRDAEGNEYALCHLPDGRVIEEWDFFRQNHK